MKLFEGMKKLVKKDMAVIFALYSLAYGITLFNNGVFWDDWVYYNVDKADIINLTRQIAMQWVGYYNIFMLSLNSIYLYRALVFVLYFMNGIFLYLLLKGIKGMDRSSRFFIVLFFVLFPVNFARIAFCNSHTALCVFAFFLGFWLVSRYLADKNVVLRIASLACVLFSFFIESLIVFYIIILAYIAYFERERLKSPGERIARLINYADFLSLPLVYWIIKTLFRKPYGVYATYNELSVAKMKLFFTSGPYYLMNSFRTSFIEPLNRCISLLSSNVVLYLAVSFALFLVMKPKAGESRDQESGWRFLSAGAIIFFMGIFPYVFIAKWPGNYDWMSRYQELTGLGAGLLFYSGVKVFTDELKLGAAIRAFMLSVFVTLFIMVNFVTYLEYQRDWFKQLSLIENFKKSELMKNNSVFLFKDNTSELDARHRSYRFYEYTGLMKQAFGDTKRFGTACRYNFEEMAALKEYAKQGIYNFEECDLWQPQYEIIIDRGGRYDIARNVNVVRLMALKFVKRAKYDSIIGDLVKLEYRRLR